LLQIGAAHQHLLASRTNFLENLAPDNAIGLAKSAALDFAAGGQSAARRSFA